VTVTVHEMEAASHGTQLGVGLGFHEYVPVLGAALQLAHLLGSLVPGEGGGHRNPPPGVPAPAEIVRSIGSILYAPVDDPAS